MAQVENGPVLRHVQAFADACQRAIPGTQYKTYNGHQPDRTRALDCWGTRAQLNALADFAIEHYERFGVTYIIWEQHIYNRNIGPYWRKMEDRGSVTNNHFDHVHISFDAHAEVEDEPPPPPPPDPWEGKFVPVLVN